MEHFTGPSTSPRSENSDSKPPDQPERSRARHALRTGWKLLTVPFRFLYRTLKVVAALLALVFLLAAGTVFYFLRDADSKLRNVAALTNPAKAKLPEPIRIFSADGQLIGQSATQHRVVVAGDDIPDVMRHAIIAIEDQRFYSHHGVDWRGIVRAAWVNFKADAVVQGASTITQQYVRNVYLDFEKTNARKIKEMSLAWQLETMWTKRRILDAYLNTVNFANGRYGVEAAARHYFGVRARQLTAAQAATLAAIVKSPAAYDPRRHPAAARARRDRVLDEMFAQGYLTRRQVLAAKESRLGLRRQSRAERRRQGDRQLTEFVLGELADVISSQDRARGGLNVHTSLRLDDIRWTRRLLEDVYGGSGPDRPLIAVSFLDPRNGRIRVMASSRDRRSFNAAADARRQPGSTVKPFTAATLLTQGGALTDPVDNSPVAVDDGQSSYTVTPTRSVSSVQDALRWSQNPAFWRLYQQAGPANVLRLQRRMGLTDMDANPAAALGGTRTGVSTLQLASAYGTFVADGVRHRPHAIVRVTDLLGNEVYTDAKHDRWEALPREYARQMTAALRRVVNDGFPQLKESISVSSSRDVGGKTGTTNRNVDAWFAGFTGQLSGAVWTGYERTQLPLKDVAGREVYGMSVPAQTWDRVARRLLAGEPNIRFQPPAGVQQVPRVVGRSLDDAQQKLARFGFTTVTTEAKFNASKPNRTVLSVLPAPGSWVRPGTPVTVTYSIAEQPMPDFVGRPYLEFLKTQSRFFRYTFRLVPSDEPTGTVLAQSIPAGQMTEKGAEVQLTLATERAAPRIVYRTYVPSDSELARLRDRLAVERRARVLPDVSGLLVEDGERVLRSLGFDVSVFGSGVVEVTDPQPGARIQDGDPVSVYGDS